MGSVSDYRAQLNAMEIKVAANPHLRGFAFPVEAAGCATESTPAPPQTGNHVGTDAAASGCYPVSKPGA